jgi:ferredoxin
MSTRGPGDKPEESDCTVEYEGLTIPARRGERLLDSLLRAGVDHRHICGGHGFCTSCRVEPLDLGSLTPVSALERERLGRDAGRLRLACQSFVRGDVRLKVPRSTSNRFSPYGD